MEFATPITDDLLARITLHRGHGPKPPNGRVEDTAGCIIDWASWLHRRVWQDSDPSIDPVLRRFCIVLNDRWDDEGRQELKPYIPRLLDTAGSKKLSTRRAYMAADWAVRTVAPTWFRAAGREDMALALERLEEITTKTRAERARKLVGAKPYQGWYSWRSAFYEAFKPKVEAELRKRGVAVAAAVAAAAAAADAAAAAAADAVAADPMARYSAVYNAVYAAMKERKAGRFGEATIAIQKSALVLLDKMIEAS